MDAVAHGTPLPYEAVRGKIANALEKAAWSRAARTIIDRLAEGAVIVGADLFRGACGQDEGSRRC
jgi:peptidyl-prolyl cis-trans isomerase C